MYTEYCGVLVKKGKNSSKSFFFPFFLSVNVVIRSFLSTTDAFDSKHRKDHTNSNFHEDHKKKSKEKEKSLTVSQWDMDVQPLVSSSEWLQFHGLKRKKLTLSQILSQIGFQHRKGIREINNQIIIIGKDVE